MIVNKDIRSVNKKFACKNSRVEGKYNEIHAKESTIEGRKNIIKGNDDEIIGDRNRVFGIRMMIRGDKNKIFGTRCTIYGNENTIKGNYVIVHGNGNIIKGDYAIVYGDDNIIQGTNATVNGILLPDTVYPSEQDEKTDKPAKEGEPACLVCYENIQNCAMFPCKHLCVCVTCSRKLKICPVCRSEIKSVVNFFR